jgi:hypothetical protein
MIGVSIYQDNVLILRERHEWVREHIEGTRPPLFREMPAQATKTHQLQPDGSWVTDGYHIDSDASAHPYTAATLREFMQILAEAGRDRFNYLVGDVLIPGRNPRKINRRVRIKEARDGGKIPPDLTAHPVGHHWICWEVDKIGDVPADVDPRRYTDRDAAFARWWIRAHLPPQFHRGASVLQWSASAFVNGKLSMHIWQWLDRPVARWSLHTFFQRAKHDPHHWCHAIDINVFGGARVHYIAPPVFKALDGSVLPDPHADRRWLWIDGDGDEACEALPDWVDQPTLESQLAAAAAERAALRQARAARAAITAKASVVAVAMAALRGVRLDLGTARQCADEDHARSVLAQIVSRLRALPANAGRHDAVISATSHAARACGAILSHDEIRDALEAACVDALLSGTPRSHATALDEFRRALDGALSKARLAGHDQAASIASTPAFAALGAASILAAAPSSAVAEDNPISLDGEAVELVVKRGLPELMEDWGIQFIDARADLAHVVTDALAVGGRWAIKAPAGLGKSHAVCEALITHRRKHCLTSTSPTIIAVPDHRLVDEIRDELRARGANAVSAVTRNVKNCERFVEFIAASKLAPQGGKRLCEACQWHPRNAGDADACPFWKTFSVQTKADFVCQSHALLALAGLGGEMRSADADVDTLPVRIDWQSFNAFAPGVRAFPCVRRCAGEVVISAKTSSSTNASPPPTPRWSDTPRWTADAMRALIEWIAKAWGCEATRRAVMDHAAPKADVVFFDWTAIGQLAGQGGLWAPFAYYEDKGFLKGHHIKVIPAATGMVGDELPQISFTDTFPILRESKALIREWIRAMWGVSTDFDLDQYARTHIDEWPVDALVIDESIQHALRVDGVLSRAHITDLRLAGEISGSGTEDLLQLMWRSEAEAKGKRIVQPSSASLRDQVGEIAVSGRHEAAEARLFEALRLEDDKQRLEHLQGGWGWESVEALRHAINHGWAGAYVSRGLLHVAAPRQLDFGGVRAVVLLDATATQSQASASLGADVHWREISVYQNPSCEVIHIPVDLGPRAAAWGDAEGPGSRRNAAHFLAALTRWGGDDSITFAHKRMLDPDKSWIASQLADAIARGAITYHGAPQSRGSNRWRDRATCIMTGHHVPRAALRQQAELLALMNNTRYDLDPDKWDAEAGWLLEGGAIVQELSRVRPLDATPDKPKRLIILDRRSPEVFGLMTTEVIDPDLLAWKALRFLPPLCDDAQGNLRLPVMQAVVADTLVLVGGCLPLGGVGIGFGSVEVANITDLTAFPLARQSKENVLTVDSLSKRINTWTRNRFRTATDFAHAMGCEVVAVNVWGRQPVAFLTRRGEAINAAQVEPYLAQLGVRDYRLGSEPWRTIGALESALLPLSRALFNLPRRRIEESTLMGLYGYAADCCGVTSKTIQRWVAKAALEGEDARACIVRLWHGAHAAMVADYAAERQTLGEEAEAYITETVAQAWEVRGLALGLVDDGREAISNAHQRPPHIDRKLREVSSLS